MKTIIAITITTMTNITIITTTNITIKTNISDDSFSFKVLLWDEPFNNEELAMSGVVGTNDEVTRIYFSNTKVISYYS